MQKLYILLGPKGCGKTYIGNLVEREFGIKFIVIESLFLKIKGKRNYRDPVYIQEGYNMVERYIKLNLLLNNEVMIETTGSALQFFNMIERLQSRARILYIRIDAPDEVCFSRIKCRNQKRHITVPDEHIAGINAIARNLELGFAGHITNSGLSDRSIIDTFTQIRTA